MSRIFLAIVLLMCMNGVYGKQWIVKFKNENPGHAYGHAKHLKLIKAHVVDALEDELIADPNVISFQEDFPVYLDTNESVPQIQGDIAQSLGLTGVGVKVGIIDSGIDTGHPDLTVAGGSNFTYDGTSPTYDCNGHGTHVAGIVKAVAPEAEIYSLKVFGYCGGSASSSTVVEAIQWAIDNGLDIINMSLSSTSGPSGAKCEAVDVGVVKGLVSVASAGNNGKMLSVGNPANCLNSIAVANSRKEVDGGGMSNSSSRGPVLFEGVDHLKPDITAPGSKICSALSPNVAATVTCTTPFGGPGVNWSGTSMSAPAITGAVALLKQKYPARTPDQIKWALKNSAADLGYDYDYQGAGEVRIADALNETDLDGPQIQASPAYEYLGASSTAETYTTKTSFNANTGLVTTGKAIAPSAAKANVSIDVSVQMTDSDVDGFYIHRVVSTAEDFAWFTTYNIKDGVSPYLVSVEQRDHDDHSQLRTDLADPDVYIRLYVRDAVCLESLRIDAPPPFNDYVLVLNQTYRGNPLSACNTRSIWYQPFVGLNEGDNVFIPSAQDVAGNTVVFDPVVVVYNPNPEPPSPPPSDDTEPPSLTLSGPLTIPRRTTATITATAVDNVGVISLTWIGCTSFSGDVCQVKTKGKPNTVYTVKATASDAAGNSTSANFTFTTTR